VSHEEVRVEREPITDENRDAALRGQEISEGEYEVVLHEEQPVVEKKVVPVERVRLATETVTGEETISADVRKEQIEEVEGSTDS
jgi:stress response protein YsnF